MHAHLSPCDLLRIVDYFTDCTARAGLQQRSRSPDSVAARLLWFVC